jgi:bifunctional enzyme CysN/CysC
MARRRDCAALQRERAARIETRFVIGLLLLKHIFALSDEGVSFISPFRSEQRMARGLFGAGEFIEVYVDTPIEVCEARDPKGLYKLARAGKLPNLTGIGSPSEPPEQAELVLAGTKPAPVQAEEVLATLRQRAVI